MGEDGVDLCRRRQLLELLVHLRPRRRIRLQLAARLWVDQRVREYLPGPLGVLQLFLCRRALLEERLGAGIPRVRQAAAAVEAVYQEPAAPAAPLDRVER